MEDKDYSCPASPVSDGTATPRQQPPKPRSALWTVCPFILGNEFCERLAYYGLATNMVIYLREAMGYDSSFAALQVTLFEGTAYITPLLGAWLADSRWGRYHTILVSSLVYLVGMICLALTAWLPGLTPPPGTPASPWQQAALFTSLYTICLGTGGIKPNVSTFGADQFDDRDPNSRAEKASFFNWFYFFVNLGSLLAATVVVWIQENVSWSIGFAIPAVAMMVAVLTFVAGGSMYKHVAPTESPMSRVVKVIWAALRNKWEDSQREAKARREARRLAAEQARSGLQGYTQPLLQTAYDNVHQEIAHDQQEQRMLLKSASYNWLAGAIAMAQDPESTQLTGHLSGYTVQQVEEVKLVVRLFPVFLTTIMYWTLYTMMSTLFVEQGAQMRRDVSLTIAGRTYEMTIPAASMSIFNTVSIIMLIPVYDSLFLPLLRKCGMQITLLQRIGWGMVVSVLSMVIAGIVERARLESWHAHGDAGGGEEADLPCAQISIMWQAGQYFIVGLSEVFTSIGQIEFFYDQAPDVMRSCSMALQLLSTSIGSYMAAILIYVVQRITSSEGSPGWIPKDLNVGRLDLFFFSLAALMAVNVLLFAAIAVNYVYKAVPHYSAPVSLPAPGSEEWTGGAAGARPAPAVVSGVGIPQAASAAIAMPGRSGDPMDDVGPYGRSLTFTGALPSHMTGAH